ncbi:hypothetical protein [Acidipropionibacterium jensenii]|uniref:hypothetical protein n=1 Tax=Acidipropionibacterium jensenii TaxID=1749 RepID=UPI0026CD5A89
MADDSTIDSDSDTGPMPRKGPLTCAQIVDDAHTRISDGQLALGNALNDLHQSWSDTVVKAFCRSYPAFDLQIDSVKQGLEEIHACLVAVARSTPGRSRPAPLPESPTADLADRSGAGCPATGPRAAAMVQGADELALCRDRIDAELTALTPRLAACWWPGADSLWDHFQNVRSGWTAALHQMTLLVEEMNRLVAGYRTTSVTAPEPGSGPCPAGWSGVAAQGRESNAASTCLPSQRGALGGVHDTGGAASASSRPSR